MPQHRETDRQTDSERDAHVTLLHSATGAMQQSSGQTANYNLTKIQTIQRYEFVEEY